mgnify:CR=1 FL=1
MRTPGHRRIVILTVFAEEAVREAEFAGAEVGGAAAVAWEQLLFAGGLWRHCAIVLKPPAIEEVGHRGEQVPNSVEELGIGSQGPEDQEDGHGAEPHGGVSCQSGLTLDTMMIVWPVCTPLHAIRSRHEALPGPGVCHHYRHNIWEITSPISPLTGRGKIGSRSSYYAG